MSAAYEREKAKMDTVLDRKESDAWSALMTILEEETDATPLPTSAEANLKNFVRNIVRGDN